MQEWLLAFPRRGLAEDLHVVMASPVITRIALTFTFIRLVTIRRSPRLVMVERQAFITIQSLGVMLTDAFAVHLRARNVELEEVQAASKSNENTQSKTQNLVLHHITNQWMKHQLNYLYSSKTVGSNHMAEYALRNRLQQKA